MGTYGVSLDRSNVQGSLSGDIQQPFLAGLAATGKKLNHLGRIFAGMDHEIQDVNSTTDVYQDKPDGRSGICRNSDETWDGRWRRPCSAMTRTASSGASTPIPSLWHKSWVNPGGWGCSLPCHSRRRLSMISIFLPVFWLCVGGNPNLKPERGRMHEAFISYDGVGRRKLSLRLFHQHHQ